MASTSILKIDSQAAFTVAVETAARVLQTGGLVAVPTETVYGLAANGLDPGAVTQIFRVKNRPCHNPLILHVADLAMARKLAADWNPTAERLATLFWPGPMTLVVSRAPKIPDSVTAGGSTVAVRWSSHPFLQSLITACGFPLAAPSANLSNRLSPTTARHVREQLGGRIELIVDAGPCQVGIESTVVDTTATPPKILRPGMIHAEAVAAGVATMEPCAARSGGTMPRSPGQSPRHYAPQARLVVRKWRDDAEFRQVVADLEVDAQQIYVVAHTRIPLHAQVGGISVVPHDATAYARAIYAELHRCDAEGAAVILLEDVPTSDEWAGIHDRLARASA